MPLASRVQASASYGHQKLEQAVERYARDINDKGQMKPQSDCYGKNKYRYIKHACFYSYTMQNYLQKSIFCAPQKLVA